MRIICELYRKINSSYLTGKCVPNLAVVSNSTKPNLIKNLSLKNELTTNVSNSESEDNGAALFIITVMCFYSISIVCMVVLNVKFKIVFPKHGCCYETTPSNDLYETQQEETKNAIDLLFSNSSKLVSSITTIVPSEINDAYDVFADANKIRRSVKFTTFKPNKILTNESILRSTTV